MYIVSMYRNHYDFKPKFTKGFKILPNTVNIGNIALIKVYILRMVRRKTELSLHRKMEKTKLSYIALLHLSMIANGVSKQKSNINPYYDIIRMAILCDYLR